MGIQNGTEMEMHSGTEMDYKIEQKFFTQCNKHVIHSWTEIEIQKGT